MGVCAIHLASIMDQTQMLLNWQRFAIPVTLENSLFHRETTCS